MAEKAPYKLSIKLTSARADAIAEALAELRRQMQDRSVFGETSTTVTIESGTEAPLTALCDLFELWLYGYKIGIGAEIKLARPGIRPETMARLRARKETPMDEEGWEDDEPVSSDRVLSA